MTRRLPAALFLAAFASHAAELPRANAPCDQTPDMTRWTSVGIPDVGAKPALISSHRGANLLAPENTLWAFRHAFAYEADFIEVDVRESADGVFYCLHDEDFVRTTGTAGQLATMTSLQIDQLNAANFEPWIGSEYDPSPVPRLEDILKIAAAAGKGIEFDIKFVKNYPLLFQMAADAGVQTRSFYNMSGEPVTIAQALFPDVRVIFNIAGDETPQALYDETDRSTVYGSRRDKFTPERIAAIHDGCSVVLPHSYDEGAENEAAEFLLMRVAGADGAQVNQPDVIRAALMAPVDTALAHSMAPEVGVNAVCLTNPNNGFGLPNKTLIITTRSGMAVGSGVSNRFGCINLPGAVDGYVVTFAADATTKAAQFNMPSSPPASPAVPASPQVANLGAADLFAGSFGVLPLVFFFLVPFARRRRAGVSA